MTKTTKPVDDTTMRTVYIARSDEPLRRALFTMGALYEEEADGATLKYTLPEADLDRALTYAHTLAVEGQGRTEPVDDTTMRPIRLDSRRTLYGVDPVRDDHLWRALDGMEADFRRALADARTSLTAHGRGRATVRAIAKLADDMVEVLGPGNGYPDRERVLVEDTEYAFWA